MSCGSAIGNSSFAYISSFLSLIHPLIIIENMITREKETVPSRIILCAVGKSPSISMPLSIISWIFYLLMASERLLET